MRVDQVAEVLRHETVKFIYTMPNFHNPAGVTLSQDRRRQLAELAAAYGAFIFEDDPYGALRYDGRTLSPIKALSNDNVIYTSTFSKTLSPGVRLGWMVASEPVITRLMQAKQGADLSTSVFNQMIACDMGQRGVIDRHVQQLKMVYRTRRDAMLAALKRDFPEGSTWTHPQGGLFVWVWIHDNIDTNEFLELAMSEAGVAYVPGIAFYPRGNRQGGHSSMRLNFSNATTEQIEEGVKRLGDQLKKRLSL